MIRVFCIFLVGEPLLLDGDEREFGFYRNEYLVSLSKERAVIKAKARTMKLLGQKATKFIDGKPFTLRVEKIKTGIPPWRIFRGEGFMFFPTS